MYITCVDKNDIITGRIDFYSFATAQYTSKPCIIVIVNFACTHTVPLKSKLPVSHFRGIASHATGIV